MLLYGRHEWQRPLTRRDGLFLFFSVLALVALIVALSFLPAFARAGFWRHPLTALALWLLQVAALARRWYTQRPRPLAPPA